MLAISDPAYEAGALLRAIGFPPTTLSKSIIMGFLTLTGRGIAISTVDLWECDFRLLPGIPS